MEFIWDEEKNQTNVEKHGLDFYDACYVFEGPTVTFLDDRYDYQEVRYITLGELEGRCVVIVHTPRQSAIRVISMRKANAREKKIFKKRLEEG
ncbi:MAG: BrnT family toxin [Gammaproteobacteria bacterium]|nr:BrnT family toxin [Gammaproteobacteria bacterium]